MGQPDTQTSTLDYAPPKRICLEWRYIRLSAANLVFVLVWLTFYDCACSPFAGRWEWIWNHLDFDCRDAARAAMYAEAKIIYAAAMLSFLNFIYVLGLNWRRRCRRRALSVYLAIASIPPFMLLLIEVFYPSLGIA